MKKAIENTYMKRTNARNHYYSPFLTGFALLSLLFTACGPGIIIIRTPSTADRVELKRFQTVGLPTTGGTPSVFRDQKARRSCITFSAIAALEAAYNRAGYGNLDLSEWFINYTGKMFWLHPFWDDPRDVDGDGNIEDTNGNGIPDEGSLKDKGANYTENQLGFASGGGGVGWLINLANGYYTVTETYMPYVNAGDYGVTRPSNNPFWDVQRNANDFNLNPENFTRNGAPDPRDAANYYSIASTEVMCGETSGVSCNTLTASDYELVLRRGHEIVIDFQIRGNTSGPIWQFVAGSLRGRGHSMLLVGFDKTNPARPYFIAKNSWGPVKNGIKGDCGEGGYTCIAYNYLNYVYAAGYIEEVNPPRYWPAFAFIGRWDLSFDGYHGTLDIYHLPGLNDHWFRKYGKTYEDWRIGTFYDERGKAYRVNGSISGSRIEFYFDGANPNLRFDKLSGSHFTFFLFSKDHDVMAGLYENPDGSKWAGYAVRSFDGMGFFGEQTSGQIFEPGNFLGDWYLNVDGVVFDLVFDHVSEWELVQPDERYWQLIGYSKPAGSSVRHRIVALVPQDDPASIIFDVKMPDGRIIDLEGKRLSWEEEIFAGSSNSKGFYALRESPYLSLTIISPTDGSSLSRSVEFRAEITGTYANPETVVWESNRDGRIGTGTSFRHNDLSYGIHNITATITGPRGKTVSDNVTITMVNNPPTVNITGVSPDTSPYQNQTVSLTGSGSDYNLTDEVMLSWYLDGASTAFATGTSVLIAGGTLSLGDHTITLVGSDGSLSDNESISITVVENPASNISPTVVIINPADGSSFFADQYDATLDKYYYEVMLCGYGSDPEDGEIHGDSLIWYGRVNGEGVWQILAEGTSPGTCREARLYTEGSGINYEIKLYVQDSEGASGEHIINVEVHTLY